MKSLTVGELRQFAKSHALELAFTGRSAQAATEKQLQAFGGALEAYHQDFDDKHDLLLRVTQSIAAAQRREKQARLRKRRQERQTLSSSFSLAFDMHGITPGKGRYLYIDSADGADVSIVMRWQHGEQIPRIERTGESLRALLVMPYRDDEKVPTTIRVTATKRGIQSSKFVSFIVPQA